MWGRAVGVVLKIKLPTTVQVRGVVQARILGYKPTQVNAVRRFSSNNLEKPDISQPPKLQAREVCSEYFEKPSSDEYWKEIGRQGNLPLIDVLLIASTWDVNKPLPNGNTLLMSVCSSGSVHPGVITKLVESGARLDMQHKISGDTPLHCAASVGDEQAVRALLAKGARPDVCNRNKHSPLDIANNRFTWSRAHSGQDLEKLGRICDMLERGRVPESVITHAELVALEKSCSR